MGRMRWKYSYQNTILNTPIEESEVDMAIMAIEPKEPPVPAISSFMPCSLIKDIDKPVKRKVFICEA